MKKKKGTGKNVRLLQSLYDKVKCTVKTDDGFKDEFDCKIGVIQGCVLSPILFT